jgi:SAM-dependent methyltransferase
VRDRGGLVLEIGCGSGLLTRLLVDAGLRVIATDASPAMLDIARRHAEGAEEIALLALPDDPVPAADAIVGTGHVLNYLDDEASVELALRRLARTLGPGGILALDLCDLAWGEHRRETPALVRKGAGWFLATEWSVPAPNRFVREMTVFTKLGSDRPESTEGSDGPGASGRPDVSEGPDSSDQERWRRDFERHDNVLLDTSLVPRILAEEGVSASIRPAFGDEELPVGLVAVVSRKAE